MPHANIYIRKENEERWNAITDKSAWVNAYLEKSPPNSVVVKRGLEPKPNRLPTLRLNNSIHLDKNLETAAERATREERDERNRRMGL